MRRVTTPSSFLRPISSGSVSPLLLTSITQPKLTTVYTKIVTTRLSLKMAIGGPRPCLLVPRAEITLGSVNPYRVEERKIHRLQASMETLATYRLLPIAYRATP